MSVANYSEHIKNVYDSFDLIAPQVDPQAMEKIQELLKKTAFLSSNPHELIQVLTNLPKDACDILRLNKLPGYITQPIESFLNEVQKTAALKSSIVKKEEMPSINLSSRISTESQFVDVSEGRFKKVPADQGINFGTFTSCLGIAIEFQNGEKAAVHCIIKPSTRTLKQLTGQQLIEEIKTAVKEQKANHNPIKKIAIVGFMDWWKHSTLNIPKVFGRIETDLVETLADIDPAAKGANIAYLNLSKNPALKDGAVVQIAAENNYVNLISKDAVQTITYR